MDFVCIVIQISLPGHNLCFDFSNVSLRGYLPLIRKDLIAHIHGLAVYVEEILHFAQDLSLEN